MSYKLFPVAWPADTAWQPQWVFWVACFAGSISQNVSVLHTECVGSCSFNSSVEHQAWMQAIIRQVPDSRCDNWNTRWWGCHTCSMRGLGSDTVCRQFQVLLSALTLTPSSNKLASIPASVSLWMHWGLYCVLTYLTEILSLLFIL